MGLSYGITCGNCGHSLHLRSGIGMLYYPDAFRVVDRTDENNMWVRIIESKEMLDEVEVIVNQKGGRIDEKNYGYQIYYSKSCKTLCSHFYFRLRYLEDGQQKVYIPKYYDENNKRLVKMKEEDIVNLDLVCPKCKSVMTIDPGTMIMPMCWD